MKNISIYFSFLVFILMPTISHAQQSMPAGAVIRVLNCTIDEGYTYAQIVERAKGLDRDENSASPIFMRRPIYTQAEYQENWDFQVAEYYPSYAEMIKRRVAAGPAGGRLPISCGNASVSRAVQVHAGEYAEESPELTTMLTRFCRRNPGTNNYHSFNRLKTASQTFADNGSDQLVQMYIPGLGGPQDPGYDFILAEVGSSMEKIPERLDLIREGLRLTAGSNASSPFACNRPALWTSTAIYRTDG